MAPDLVTPEQGIRLLPLRLVPYLQELLCRSGMSASFPRGKVCPGSSLSYLDAPFPDLVGIFLGIWPVQSRPKRPSHITW